MNALLAILVSLSALAQPTPALCQTTTVLPDTPENRARVAGVQPTTSEDGTTTIVIDASDLLQKIGGVETTSSTGESKGATQTAKGTDIKGNVDSSAPGVVNPGGQSATGGSNRASYEAEFNMPEPQTLRILMAVIGVMVAGLGGWLLYTGNVGLGIGLIVGGGFLIAGSMIPALWWILGLLGILAAVAVGVIAFIKYAGTSKLRDAFEEVVDGVAALKPDKSKYPMTPDGEKQYLADLQIYENAKALQFRAQSPTTRTMVADYKTKEGA